MHRYTHMCMRWTQDVCCWLTVNVTASLLRCIIIFEQIGSAEFGSLDQWFSSSVGALFLDGLLLLPCMIISFCLCSLTSIPCLSLRGVSDSFPHNVFTVARRMFISFVVKSSSLYNRSIFKQQSFVFLGTNASKHWMKRSYFYAQLSHVCLTKFTPLHCMHSMCCLFLILK